jgi:hypothetical protein
MSSSDCLSGRRMSEHCLLGAYFIVLDHICLNIRLWGFMVVAISAAIIVTVWSGSDMKKDVPM